jgi:hypothetical protein
MKSFPRSRSQDGVLGLPLVALGVDVHDLCWSRIVEGGRGNTCTCEHNTHNTHTTNIQTHTHIDTTQYFTAVQPASDAGQWCCQVVFIVLASDAGQWCCPVVLYSSLAKLASLSRNMHTHERTCSNVL